MIATEFSSLTLVEQFAYALELSVGIVFLVAFSTKSCAPSSFARTVRSYRLRDRA